MNYVKLVSFWLKELVMDESKYELVTEENGKNLVINVNIEKESMGKIIGKNGNIITALRNLVNTISKKDKKNVKIIIKDI